MQTGWSETRNGVFCPGVVNMCAHYSVEVEVNVFDSRFCSFTMYFSAVRFVVTPWASTALAKLGSGASGATPQLPPHPTVVRRPLRGVYLFLISVF